MVLTAAIKTEDDQTVGKLVLNEKQFKTGSKGFFGQGKDRDRAASGTRPRYSCVLIKGQDTRRPPPSSPGVYSFTPIVRTVGLSAARRTATVSTIPGADEHPVAFHAESAPPPPRSTPG